MEYNTEKERLILPEYGRNIQEMVGMIKKIEDREERNLAAQAMIEVMGNINPHLRDVNDFKHKLWDQLFQMADFDLDIDSPYPTPVRETFETKPKEIPYVTDKLHYKYLGRIMQKLIKAAVKIENKDEQNELLGLLTNHMKKLYVIWNKDDVADEYIFDKLNELSDGELQIEEGTKLLESKEFINMKRRKKLPKMPKKNKNQNN